MPDDNAKRQDGPQVRKTSRRRRSSKPRVVSKLLGLLAESFPKATALLKVARDWSRRKPLWIRVPLYSSVILGAAIYVFGDSLLKLPVIAGIHDDVSTYVDDLFAVPLPRASGTAFAIAITRIEDDGDGTVGRSLG